MVRVLLGLILLGTIAWAGDAQTVELKVETHREWAFELPAPAFAKIDGTIPIGPGFKVEAKSGGLAIDTDGDGKTDRVIRGDAGIVKLRAGDFRYTVGVANRGNWQFTTACTAAGEVDGTPVRLIDQNNNGRFDDFGADAMIVGHGRSASFLSRTILLRGKLFAVAVEGRTLKLAPFAGEQGKLDVRTAFESDGRLTAAVFTSGQHSFELSATEGPVAVPAGSYTLSHGVVKNGGEIVRIKHGRAKEMVVKAGATTVVTWGGPLLAEYAYQRTAGSITFAPDKMRFFGRAGEEYYGFFPSGRSPEFTLRNAATKKEIAVTKFVPS